MLNSTPDSLFAFVKDNIYSNPSDLLMKYSGKDLGFNLSFAITQIKNRRKTIRKLPSFTSNFYFRMPYHPNKPQMKRSLAFMLR